MNDKIDDADSLAATIKPSPRFSQKPTIPIKAPTKSRRKNWEIFTSISFCVILIIAIILYCLINHPFRHVEKNVKINIVYSSEPILITAPIKSYSKESQDLIINSSEPNNQPMPHKIKNIKKENNSKDKDYGI